MTVSDAASDGVDGVVRLKKPHARLCLALLGR